MRSKFEHETARVKFLMQRLGLMPTEYRDPQTSGHARDETGADVVALINGCRVGIQVTDLDSGDVPGESRAAEVKLARDAERRGGTYAAWAQNRPNQIITGIARSIARKSLTSFAGFDEFWLLVCAGVPQPGAIVSTMVLTPWLHLQGLDAATTQSLSASKYTQAFLHVGLGLEEQALYQWRRGGTWSKSTLAVSPEDRGPSFWDCRSDPDLLSDPDSWCDRAIEKFFAERQSKT